LWYLTNISDLQGLPMANTTIPNVGFFFRLNFMCHLPKNSKKMFSKIFLSIINEKSNREMTEI
jgi:hypothetical protein